MLKKLLGLVAGIGAAALATKVVTDVLEADKEENSIITIVDEEPTEEEAEKPTVEE